MIMKKLSILFLIFILSVVAPAAQTNYKTYTNARFGYSISYPADLLKAQGETSNSDGQVFANDDAEMRVFGTNMLLNKSLSKEYNAIVKEHGAENVTYKTLKKNFFVVRHFYDRIRRSQTRRLRQSRRADGQIFQIGS
jgi:hypothetical protein